MRPSPPPCKASDLQLTYVQQPQGMTLWSTDLTLTNRGAATCSLSGYPTVSLQTAASSAVVQPFQTATAGPFDPINSGALQSIPATAFGIAPGSSAYFYLVSSTRSGQCDLTRTFTVVLHLSADPATTTVVKNFTPASCDGTPDGTLSPLTPVPPSS